MTETIGRPEMAWAAPDKAMTAVDRSWWSWGGPHGGLLASLAVSAAEHTVPEQPVRELSAQFLAPPAEGPVELKIQPLRRNGSSSVLAVTLGGHVRGSGDSGADVALATTVLLGGSRPSRSVQSVPAPAVPGWERCPTVQLPVELLPFLQHLDYPPATDTALLGGGSRAEFIGWLRLNDDSPLNASALTVLVDALPPALYATFTAPVPVPTAAMSVQYTAPAPAKPADAPGGWVLGRIKTRSAGGGWCVDDSDLWAPGGQLLASARQTRRVLER
jgi:acyl-CoA thioesterase